VVLDLLNILLPIYGSIALGFFLGRLGFCWDSKVISPLVLQVTFPLLVIHQLTRPGIHSSNVLRVLLAAFIVASLLFVIFAVLLRIARLSLQTYLAPAALANMSIGLALGMHGFGNQGFVLSLAFGVVILLAQFTLGRWLPNGEINIKTILRQVFLYALILGIALLFLGVHLPPYLGETLHLVGQLTIPLLLLSLGFALAKVSLHGFARGMLLATIRLAVCVAIGIGVAWALSLQGQEKAIVILMSILPSSTVNILMGQEAGIDMEPVTIFITCTNLWLLVSLPVALALLL
jgi:predicted permease